MTGVGPNLNTQILEYSSSANDLRPHTQQHRWPARKPSTSEGSRNGIIYRRAPHPPIFRPLGGPARSLNINESVYTKAWGILLMLSFRGAINVAQFSGLAIMKMRRADFIGNSPQTTVPGIHDKGKAAGQRSRQTSPTTVRSISKHIEKSPINVS